MKNRRPTGFFAVQSMIFTMLIVIIFMGGIVFFYTRLYTETREHITKIGELDAETSAEQIDKHLSSGVDTLRLTSYSLDNMIRNGSSQEEILDFLKNQSVAISNITSGSSPGFYGYINSGYLDGTGWIPDEGYVATERPWYVGAQASIGRISIVGPYIDSETHKSVVTVSKTLCDVKSVIAMDFFIDQLQTITEELASKGESYAQIILDREYRVIAHSDKSQIGQSYLSESGTFGRALVDGLRGTDENLFFMDYGGSNYMIYTTTVANDWFCISVIDATASLDQLKKPMIFIVSAVLSIIVLQLAMLVRENRNIHITEQLSKDLSHAEDELSEKNSQIGEISRMAFKDALTGVGSKTAFDQFSEELAEKHRTEITPTAVVMFDVNILKKVNDNYGHDAGDKYLRGCCQLICNTFKHSPVFRIGGDEFVAVLQGGDHEARKALIKELNAACEMSCAEEDREPWERYSIAAGMAEWEPDEPSLDKALLRADKLMYEAKRKFKEKLKQSMS